MQVQMLGFMPLQIGSDTLVGHGWLARGLTSGLTDLEKNPNSLIPTWKVNGLNLASSQSWWAQKRVSRMTRWQGLHRDSHANQNYRTFWNHVFALKVQDLN